jgi:hypothetical protein
MRVSGVTVADLFSEERCSPHDWQGSEWTYIYIYIYIGARIVQLRYLRTSGVMP